VNRDSISAEDYNAMLRGKRRKGLPNIPGVKISEKEFQRDVVKMASDLGWTHYHTVYAVGADTGYPDLTLVHPRHGVIWLELKTYAGTVSWEQTQWIELLRESGQMAFIVYPDVIDFIQSLLEGKQTVEERSKQ
jgi:hypothetical protein